MAQNVLNDDYLNLLGSLKILHAQQWFRAVFAVAQIDGFY